MWIQISSIFEAKKKKAIEEFSKILIDFENNPECIEKNIKQMDNVCFQYLQSIIKDKASNIDILMNQKFNSYFNMDKTNNTPRRWKPGDNVTQEWSKAKHEAEQLLDLFGLMRLNEKYFDFVYFEFDPDTPIIKSTENQIQNKDLIILTRTECERNLQRFRDHAITSYNYAQKEMERAEVKGQVPFYFLALLLLLGWNELVWVIQMILFNPFMLFFMILMCGVAFVVWRLNLTPVLISGIRMFINEGKDYVKFKLQEIERQKQPANSPPPSEKKKVD